MSDPSTSPTDPDASANAAALAAETPPATPRAVLDPLDLLLGFPSLILAALVLAVLTAAWYRFPVKDYYQKRLEAHQEAGDLPAMLVSLKRLVTLEPQRQDRRFQLGVVYDRLGAPGRALGIMRTLAPPGQPGYLPAHAWLADFAFRGMAVQPALAKEAERHLVALRDAIPNDPGAMARLGTVLALTGRAAEARKSLGPIASGNPHLLLLMADCSAKLDDNRSARDYLELARSAARDQCDARPDDPVVRLLLADCEFRLGETAAGLAELAKVDLSKQPKLSPAFLNLCTRVAIDGSRDGTLKPADVVNVLELGFRAVAGAEPLHGLVNASLASDAPRDAALRSALEGAAQSEALRVPILHGLGNRAWAKGDRAEARRLWEQAYVLEPDNPLNANNLAYALATTDPADPPRALAMIEKLRTTFPADPRLLATQGQILCKLARWPEALADLERARTAGVNDPDLDTALAEARARVVRPTN